MIYPIVIHHEAETECGVTVPDLAGCFSAGGTLEVAVVQAREAIELHLEGLLEEGYPVPPASSLDALQAKPRWQHGIWALVEIDPAKLAGSVRRINITIPERVLRRIDASAARLGESRSGFISRLALQASQEGPARPVPSIRRG